MLYKNNNVYDNNQQQLSQIQTNKNFILNQKLILCNLFLVHGIFYLIIKKSEK